MVDINAKTFPKNSIHTIIQLKKRERTSFMGKNSRHRKRIRC